MLIQAAHIATHAADLLGSEHEAERVLGLRCLLAVTAAGVGLPAHIMDKLAAVPDKLGFKSLVECRVHGEIMAGQMGPVTPLRFIRPATPLRQNDPPVPFLDTASLLEIEFVKAARGAEGFHRFAVADDLSLVAECEGGYRGFKIGQLSTNAGLDLPTLNPECELYDD